MPSEPQPDQPGPDELPPQGMRTAINFLLFVHLFTVGMLILFAGSSSPAAGTLSLRQQLRRIPGYYLQVLGMDMDFDSGQRYNRPMEYDEIKVRLDEITEHLKYIEEDPTRRHQAEATLTFITDQQNESPHDPSRRGLLHLTNGGTLDVAHSIDLVYAAHLFRVPFGPGEDLNTGQIADSLRKAFRDHQIGLPRNGATVTVVDAGREWQIVARIDGESRAFVVRRSDQALDVYENRMAQLPEPEFRPHLRFLRYQMLAREMARLSSVDSVRGILPSAVVSWMVRKNDDLSLDEKLSTHQVRLVLRRRITQQEFVYRREKFGINPEQLTPEDPFWYVAAFEWTPRVVAGRVLFNEVEGNARDFAPPVAEQQAAGKKKPKEETR